MGYLEQNDSHEHSIQKVQVLIQVEELAEENQLLVEEVVEKYHIQLLLVVLLVAMVGVVGSSLGGDGGVHSGGGGGHSGGHGGDNDCPCLLHS